MSSRLQFTKRQKALYIIVWVIFLMAALFLYGVGLSNHNPIFQGLGAMLPVAPGAWAIAFFHKEPQFPWRWRGAGATAVVLIGILADFLLSSFALGYQNTVLVGFGVLVCIAPVSLFRIIERQQTAREKEK